MSDRCPLCKLSVFETWNDQTSGDPSRRRTGIMNRLVELKIHSSDDNRSIRTNSHETTTKNCCVGNNAFESRDSNNQQLRKKREYSFVLYDQARFTVMYNNNM